ncbi:MAG: aminotransferase class I/II-fold pyridoxal phosphate-dependent enzyme, partial [Pseudomonadota bacterium]
VDEAYIEFSAQPSVSRWLNDYPNLIVLRTLSKAYGLAGARVGATLASKTLITQLKKVLAPYPIAQPVIECLRKEPLQFNPYPFQIEKERVLNALKESSKIIEIFPSDANFFLCRVENSQVFFTQLLKLGILVRDRHHKVNNSIRISIGTNEQNTQLIRALKNLETLND